MRRLPALLFVLALSQSCRDVLGPTVFFDQEFVLAPGEEAHLANTRRSIAFDRVEGDSRCPADVFCVQGGDALVKIRVIEGNQKTAYELHTGSMKPVAHEDMTIILVQLAPYPFSSGPIKPNDYRATLSVTRND